MHFNLFQVQILRAFHWNEKGCRFRHEQILSDYLHNNRLLTCHAKHVVVLFGSEFSQMAYPEDQVWPRRLRVFR